MKKLSIVFIILALSLLFAACGSDEPIKIEAQDSIGLIKNEEEATTLSEEVTTSTENTVTETTTVSENTTVTQFTDETTDNSTATTVISSTAASVQIEQTKAPEGQTVYITPSGKRYHLSSTCGGKNSYSVSIDDIGSRTPCQKCAQ